MLKDVIIKDISQHPISDDTTSQKTKRKIINLSNQDNQLLQRLWLSYWYPRNYVLEEIGGSGSFVYMIGSGVNQNNWVSNFFHFVGFFKPKV
jgi:hypothetical protein